MYFPFFFIKYWIINYHLKVCLGALVNEKQVVTAGHCFADRTLYLEKARLFPDRFGVIPLNLNIDVDLFKYPKDFQLFTVDHINIHPDFEYTAQVPFEIKNDVAIVTLKNSIPRPSAHLDLKIKPWSCTYFFFHYYFTWIILLMYIFISFST